ncbi:MAG TPA: amidohydrolase family protein [Rubricoccaceae bacterium]|jgi:imidazolonepropionase-like amidohydrolase
MRRLAVLAALVVLALPVRAQRGGVTADTPRRPVTRAAALVGARVVVSPGRVLDRATVLIRDGRIEAVGRDLRVPADADVLAADSFTVYAGFVDALGNAGVPTPPEVERFTGNRGDPPRDRSGLEPDRDVRETFDPSDARVAALRALGFGAAHIAPRGGLLSGQGAVVLLRPPGRDEAARDVVFTGPVSLVARMQTAEGVYPSTPMGVAAVFREAFENARRREAQAEGIARGGQRPRFDAALDALGPVLAGDRRLVMLAPTPLDAFRALGLARDAGVEPIVAGLADAAPVTERLRAERIAVFAPLALPDTVALDSLARTVALPPSSGVASVQNRRVRSFRDLPAERAALTAERRESVRRAEASPAALAAAGVPFAFATLEADPAKILPGLRRMVRAGLTPDDALAALTVAPARLLGLSNDLGTVERGRLANLVVVRGDLFADSAVVRYVFVEGQRTENPAKPRRASASADSSATGVGTWTMTVSTPSEEQRGAFTITGTPGAYTGTATVEGETIPLEAVTLDGDALSFRFTVPDVGLVEISGTVSGPSFSGTVSFGTLGSFPATAIRSPDR